MQRQEGCGRNSDVRRVLFVYDEGTVVAKVHDHAGTGSHPDDDLARRLREVHALVSEDFDAAHGFGRLVEIDYLDGLRLHFEGGDVAHVRASGNAPQLRIYALASDDERARKIVELALAEDGLLATMLARG